ncbi:MAG: c-type cytochrome domain-containing protein, partial [Planctomycetota bacterium]|nr:c-type cytochrome domain-containing protein [Planctomycetota bacterium]
MFADESSSGRVAGASERTESIDQVNSGLFSTTIRPLLARRCFECHGPDEETRESDLRLDQQESAHADRGAYSVIDAFNPEESELILRVISDDPDLVMPPPETGYQLTEMEIQQLRQWIDAGGEFEKHWACLPPQAQSSPAVVDSGWCTNEID